ncbi:MAG: hypothetical protein LCH99_11185 [Proteobacteria bacterium]|nr:hypothetical protein [Pseudomonadota bacterium]
MNMTDINHDIARGDIRGIEDAFRALVGWPNEDEIRGSSHDTRKRALVAVCEALSGDSSIMPGAITDLIADETGRTIGGTYADGAAAVLWCLGEFEEKLGRAA